MAFDYINEAFKRLDLLEEQLFDTSLNGINQLSDFMETEDDTVRVIDPEAETPEMIKDSYVGKVIVNCNICHSHIFENKEDIKIEEDGLVNMESACPYCGESEGFTIVGEIVPFNGVDTDVSDETEVDVEETQETPEEETPLDEALSVGAGLALGGAAIGAGNVLSKLVDDVNPDDTDEVLTEEEVEEGLIGDINLSLDASDSSVGFLGGSANTTNEDIEDVEDAEKNMSVKMSRATRRAMREDFKEISITTEDQHMEMSSDENGKVTVTTEPVNNVAAEEVIAPVSDETQAEILNNNSDTIEEEPLFDEDTFDYDFEDIDEEGLDELGEAYLRNVYENVQSFKTQEVSANDSALIVEGIISFNSGTKKKTGFIFEAKDVNSRGQLRFIGSNKHLAESANAFSLVGRVDNKKLFVESLKYNYKVNNEVVRGLVRRK